MGVSTPIIAVTLDLAELPKFTLWKDMFRGLMDAGSAPLAIDSGQPRTDWETVLADVDGLVISGGTDVDPHRYGGDRDDPAIQSIHPVRDSNEITAYRVALARGIPILAICRGAQLINVELGGSLIADLQRDRPGTTPHWHTEDDLAHSVHNVFVEPGSRLSSWLGTSGDISVNSQHHQGIAELAPSLVATASAPDGLIEAFELPGREVIGVQWHPEVLWPAEPHALALLTSFANTAERGAEAASARC